MTRRATSTAAMLATLLAAAGSHSSDAAAAEPVAASQSEVDAELVKPADGDSAGGASAVFEVRTRAGASVELTVNTVVVPAGRIGERTIDNQTGEVDYFYYGVALQPGPNIVAFVGLGADGLRGVIHHGVVYGPGPATQLSVSVSGPLRADGRSVNTVTVRATDAWGHPALPGTAVELALLAGDVRLERMTAIDDMRAATSGNAVPGAQTIDLVTGANGIARVRLLSGTVGGNIDIRATCGPLEARARSYLAPNVRAPIVAGIITGGLGSVPGDPGAPDGIPDGVNARRARIALYATGALDAKTLATFAYDTASRLERSTSAGAFIADPTERPYTNYGDTSVRRDDALSRDHLFAEIDRDQMSLGWGEFSATTAPATGAGEGYTQLVDGARLKLADAHRSITAFAARNDVAYDRRVFAPSGLASAQEVLHPNIVVGSETVTIVALDRHTGAVTSQTPLTPNVDYVLNDADGQFRFIDIPLPFDENGNPQQVVLSYEYAATGANSVTTGGRAELGLGHGIEAGAGYVNDTSGAGNMTLFNADFGGRFKNGSWSISDAHSRGNLGLSNAALLAPLAGNALHAALTLSAGADTVSAQAASTTAGFSNPFGGLSTPGLVDARATYVHRLRAGAGDIALTIDHQANVGVGQTDARSEIALRFHRLLSKRLSIVLGLLRQSYRAGSPSPSPSAAPTLEQQSSGGTTIATLGIGEKLGSRLSIDVTRTQTISGLDSLSQPDQTQMQAAYRIGDTGRLFVRETISAQPAQSFAASTIGLTSVAAATRSTEIGLEKSLSPTLSVDTEYLVNRTGSGTDIFAAMGVRERLTISSQLHGDAYLQRADAAGANVAGFTAYGASLAFAGDPGGIHATASFAQRNGGANGMSFSLAAAGPLAPDVSIFASVLAARSSAATSDDAKVGLAWRSGASDRTVTLAQFEHSGGDAISTSSRSGVVSVEEFFRPDWRTEFSARFAYKLDGDAEYAANTSLLDVRVDRRIGPRFDIGVEGRRSSSGIAGSATTGLAAEVGLRMGDTLRVAAGYNVRRIADPSLALTPSKCGFYVTATSVVDALFGWGRKR